MTSDRDYIIGVIKMACADHGHRFLCLMDDASNEEPINGFSFVREGADPSTTPEWVSYHKACRTKWDGSGGH